MSISNCLPEETRELLQLEPMLEEALRIHALRNHRSMEAEIQNILRDALRDEVQPSTGGLASAIRRHFMLLGAVGMPEQSRGSLRQHPGVTAEGGEKPANRGDTFEHLDE